jgi:hypothetical protein
MKIAYLLHWPEGPESGVFRKVLDQVSYWVAAGHSVTFFLAAPPERRPAYEDAVKGIGAALEYFPMVGFFGRWMRWRGLKRRLEAGKFDAIYHRFDLATPGLISAMKPGQWVVEINSNDRVEYALTPGLRDYYNRLTRNRLFSRAGTGIFVTRELANAPEFSAFRGPREVIANGSDFRTIPQAPVPSAAAPVELLFMGSDGHSWHGVDKLTALAKARPDWTIHALGVSEVMFHGDRPKNIQLPGRLARKDYVPLVARCAAGFGTLALHRKQMNEACALKVREYLAFGLPVILGYTDVDIPNDASYALHLSNTEDNVSGNIERIGAFVEGWRGRRVPRNEITHLDSAVKEQQRLAVLKRFSGV